MINAPQLKTSGSTLSSIRHSNARALIEQEYDRTLESVCDLIYQTSLYIEQHNKFSDAKALTACSPELYESVMVRLVVSVSSKLDEIKKESLVVCEDLCGESTESEENFFQLLKSVRDRMNLVRWHAEETVRLYSAGILLKV